MAKIIDSNSDDKLEKKALLLLVGLVLLTILGSIAGGGSAIRLLFITSSVGIGFYLFSKSSTGYVNFTLWLWFLAPFLRRLTDYYSNFDNLGVMILAPYLVTAIASIKALKNFHKLGDSVNMAFLLSLTAVIYSFCIGWLNNSAMAVIRAALDWMPPIVFSLYLALNWHIYPLLRKSFQTTFTWGGLLMGTYGILQFLTAPAWDTYWMNSASISSVGQPIPLGIRVWSTMNAPGPFSSVILAGLLILLSRQSLVFIPAYISSFLAFLLSGVRASWLGWILGQSMLMSSVKSRLQIRLILIGALLVLLIIPLSTIEPFQERIGSRISTFSNISEDGSFQARSTTYENNLSLALSTILGRGLGGTSVIDSTGRAQKVALDSGILDIFFTLGWVGAIPYFAGFIMLFLRQFFIENHSDVFMSATKAISAANVLQLAFGNTATGIGGLVLWSFLGLNLAASRYYLSQGRRISISSS